jgi:hypothetical protein
MAHLTDRRIEFHIEDAWLAVRTNDATVYGPSTTNGRRTKADIARLDAFILVAVGAERPTTVRSAFYRVMSLGAVPKSEESYRSVGRRILELRRCGEMPYNWITDGTRYVLHPPSYGSVEDALKATARAYRRNLWADSDAVIQVFAEKDAISGVLRPVCDEWDVALGIARGYASETFTFEVAEDLDRRRLNMLLNFGDHDPSGVHAWENFVRKVKGFAPDAEVEAVRLAVTPEQVDEMRLPLRPTKASDSRARGWIGGSVEVDAIPASVLRQLLEDEITSWANAPQLEILRTVEREERELILSMAVARASTSSPPA